LSRPNRLIEHCGGAFNNAQAILPPAGEVIRSGPPLLKGDDVSY